MANIYFPNYSFVHTLSQSNADGVAVYLSLNLKFSSDGNQHQLYNSDSIWLNLHHHENKSPIRLAVIYRHPSTTNIEKFLGDFSSCLNEVTSGGKTLIPFVIPVRDDSSDHYVVGYCINDSSKPLLKNVRDKSALNSELFCEDLANNLSIYFEKLPALNTGNYNKIFDRFSQTILSTIDIHAPKKKLSCRQQRLQNKPWLTKRILVSICKRHFMFKSHFLLGNDGQKSFFRKYSNKLTTIIALAKKLYYSSMLNQNKNN